MKRESQIHLLEQQWQAVTWLNTTSKGKLITRRKEEFSNAQQSHTGHLSPVAQKTNAGLAGVYDLLSLWKGTGVRNKL